MMMYILQQAPATSNPSNKVIAPPGRAPAAHPHTIDPFREVKEYMKEAEDYAIHFNDRCNVRFLCQYTKYMLYTMYVCICNVKSIFFLERDNIVSSSGNFVQCTNMLNSFCP